MKKFLLIATLCLFGTNMALAQSRAVFSSALGGSTTYTSRGVRQTMYRPTPTSAAQPARKAVSVKKTVIRYAPSQVAITEAQTEKLAPFIKRLQDGKIKSVQLVGIVRDYNMSYHRLKSLANIIKAYSGAKIDYKHITGPSVLKSNDNTVEIIEYR